MVDPADQHPLDKAHSPYQLLRLRDRPDLRRPRRSRPGWKGHDNLHPRGPPRGSNGTSRPDQRGPSAGGEFTFPASTNFRPAGMTMRSTDNGTSPRPGHVYQLPEDGPLPDTIWRNTTVSLTTASLQRTAEAAWSIMSQPPLAIWLAASPQSPVFAQGLVRFHGDRSRQPCTQDPATHPRTLRDLPGPARRPPGSCNTASPAAPTLGPDRRELRSPPVTRSTGPT